MTNVADRGTLTWATRADLTKTVLAPAKASGLLLSSPTADVVVPLTEDGRAHAGRLTRSALSGAGLAPGDRVVVALGNDYDLGGARIAEAAAEVADAAVAVGPRGRMRLLEVLERTSANVLVATPTGAADLLARLHMEFLVDPLDLELRLLVLTGEIADDKTYRHLAAEFGAEVVELWTDPVTGIPLAHRDADRLVPVEPSLLAVAALDQDVLLDPPSQGELVVRHGWHAELSGVALRTGFVVDVDESGALLAPRRTVGDAILVRGRWLSLNAVGKALAKIDGITHWRFDISRKGTLDTAVLTVSFGRESLVRNGMWKGRIEQALTALTPVKISVDVAEDVREDVAPPEIVDHRGQHLGIDRADAAS